MTEIEFAAARNFAVEVVSILRQAGFQSLWAGGCVRDELLGLRPKDFDVATSATPEQVRAIFGRRRTIPMGAAFGVITVLGRREQGQIEVATFRRDAAYSDGRHPDSVSFSTPEEDALRRDFTINGLFFDPLSKQLIDYVGGQEDLKRGVVRAIRDPAQRIAEDKLRMLRGVRFAATFGFELDPATQDAIHAQADSLVMVSAERVAQELRRMLVLPRRRRAVELLAETDLLRQVLPESDRFFQYDDGTDLPDQPAWQSTLMVLDALSNPTFAVSLAALLRQLIPTGEAAGPAVATVCGRWRLSNHETRTTAWLLAHEPIFREAHLQPWPSLQRLLIAPEAPEMLDLLAAVVSVTGSSNAGLQLCQAKMSLPSELLNPPPLVTGHDLKQANLKPGPRFKELLEGIRDEQLLGRLTTRAQALDWARQQLS